jgi:hypothetical protein
MISELERERLDLERKRIEMLRQRRIAAAKKLGAAVVATGALAAVVWFATKTSKDCCPPDIDAGVAHDAPTEATKVGPRDDGGRKNAVVQRPRETHKAVDCFLDRATGKPCPAQSTSCANPTLLEGDEFKHWKKDYKNCATITLCSCLQH